MSVTEEQVAAIRPDALAGAMIAAKAKAVGEGKASMSAPRALAPSVIAGFFIGMGGMFMLLVKSDSSFTFVTSSLLGGLAFSLGLFSVLVAGAELFTGNSLMVLGLLEGRYGFGRLLKSWAVVYAGNFVGSLALVLLLVLAGYPSVGGGAVGTTMVTVAAGKCALPWATAFARGVMCNILVCLAVWMGFAGRTVVDKFLAAVMPVCAFVACGFEHSVANMFFIPMGMAALSAGAQPAEDAAVSALGLAGLVSNLSAVTLGNVVGGAVLFAGIYWLSYGRER